MFGFSDINISFHNHSFWVVILFAALAVFLSLRLYWKTNPPISKMIRLILIFLRFIVILSLLITLLNPLITYRRTFQRNPRLSLIIDSSLSVQKKINGISRIDLIDSLLSSERFEEIKSDIELSIYYFGSNLSDDKNAINKEQTTIGNTLRDLNLIELENPSDYWFLISDGNNNNGSDPIDVIPSIYHNINTVDLSITSNNSDIEIDKIDVNQILYAGERTDLNVTVRWNNVINSINVVELIEDNKVIASKNVNINQLNGLSDLSFDYRPSTPGQKLLKIEVSTVENEENTNNNSKTVSVNVLKSKLAVLLVSENPDYELSFLKRLLGKSNKYELDFTLTGNKSGNLKSNFPARQIELNRYDLIILHDPNMDKLSNRVENIKSYLYDRGGSLWVMMGRNMGSQLLSHEFREFLPFYHSKINLRSEFNLSGKPNDEFVFHPVVSFGSTQKEIFDNWSKLPPFEFIIFSDYINPSAKILASTEDINGVKFPIIGFINYGAGKVFTTGALPFWTWGFVNKGFGEDDNFYNEFINETVSWLTLSDDFDPIRISTDKNIYHRLEKVNFTAYVFDVGFRPLSGVSGIISVINENNESFEKDLKSVSDGKFIADYSNLSAGQYSYNAKFIKDNILLKELTGKFLIEPYSIEEFDNDGNPEIMKTIASMSGGKYYQYEDFDIALANIDLKKRNVSVNGEITLSNRFLFLLIILIAISTEWLLRRLYQLI